MKTNLQQIYIADAYYRLSRDDGDKIESDSIVNQKALVKEFLKVNPDIQIHEEKVDDGYTGVNFKRPAFISMMEDIKAGKVNCVIVKDLSRFGRNYIESGRYIEKIFPYLGVRFISITDNIDSISSLDSTNELMIPFKNLMNDAYCRDISIKVRSHLDIKRKNGQFIGSFAPYGYIKSPENKNQLIVDEQTANVVRRIFDWKLDGMSGGRIADKLNELGVPTPYQYKQMNGEKFYCGYQKYTEMRWSAATVNHILRNEVYTGALIQGKTYSPNYKVRKRMKKKESEWIRCENNHEPIITKEEFQLIREMFLIDTRVSPEEEALYLFSGLVKCGWCGGNMTRKTVTVNGKKYVYLVCAENKKKNNCKNNKAISIKKFEEVIRKVINLHIEKVFDMNNMLNAVKTTPFNRYVLGKMNGIILEKEKDIEKKNNYIKTAYGDYVDGILSKREYDELKEFFQESIQNLHKEIQAIKQEKKQQEKNQGERTGWIKDFLEYRGFQKLSRKLLLKLVEEIRIYDKDRIEVIFKFQSEYEEICKYLEEVNIWPEKVERG